MRFKLEELEVFFPYDFVYKEQHEYMLQLKHALDKKGHALLEMPTGTGKTVCLLSLITSYKYQYPQTGKLIYCTRTVPEMVKCMEEIRALMNYRARAMGNQSTNVLAICLSARRNLCIHDRVMSDSSDGESVDSSCRAMTASWVRNQSNAAGTLGPSDNSEIELCSFYEKFEQDCAQADIPPGIYSLDDMKSLGRKRGWCPYFAARHMINRADIIVYNYQYMLDPKVSNLVSRELEKESIVVFDEAHNIDNVCIEALSVSLDTRALEASSRSIHKLQRRVEEMKASDSQRLQREYRELINGLIGQGALPGASNNPANLPTSAISQTVTDSILASPVLSQDVINEAVPGSIRKAEHFLSFLKGIVVYLKTLLSVGNSTNSINMAVENKTPLNFLAHLQNATALERKPLRFTYARLNSLLRTLEVTSLDQFNALTDVANFITLVSTYMEGFAVILEPMGSNTRGISEPLIQLTCLDASIAIKPVLDKYQNVIITSGTLSPMDLYPKLLNIQPIVSCSLPMFVFRSCLLPLVVTRGSDQLPISTRFESRSDAAVVRNYGQLLVDVAKVVPDGVCVFFPSYLYMEETVRVWTELGILNQVLEHKLVFLETKDVVETTLALENFKRSCDIGKGAVFLSISRGKVAEGVDFDRHYGRCVIVMGVPYQYTLSHTLRARLDFMRDKYRIRGNDFLTFDALRQASQCIGRVIRSKTDYGVVMLADSRFNKQDKRSKFPQWVLRFLSDSSLNLSVDVAVEQTKVFLRQMGQPVDEAALQAILLDEQQAAALNADFLRSAAAASTAASDAAASDAAAGSGFIVSSNISPKDILIQSQIANNDTSHVEVEVIEGIVEIDERLVLKRVRLDNSHIDGATESNLGTSSNSETASKRKRFSSKHSMFFAHED